MKSSNKNKSVRKNPAHSFGQGLENLETRQMFSASPLDFYTVGSQLVCELTSPSEQVTVVRSSNGIQFNVNGQVENVVGNFSYLSILAQSGNNSIVIGPNMTIGACVWGGNGTDLLSTGANNTTLHAGSGNETLVALGSNDVLDAGSGCDNLWSNYNNYYNSGSGTLVTHFFQSFMNTSDSTLDGQLINEPGTNTASPFNGGWENVSALPLFSSLGPNMFDLNQGQCGDCYFMSGLGAIARVDPQQIRNSITALGDGTYAMEFYNNGTPEYIRVDGYLPEQNGNLFYDNLGLGNSTWAALMEKGYAYFDSMVKGETPDYGVIDQGGYADPTLQQLLGDSAQGTYNTMFNYDSMAMFGGSANTFAGWINWQMQQGKAIEIAFGNDETDAQDSFSLNNILENHHMYTLASETMNSAGQITGYWVHNPWGVDIQNPQTDGFELAAKGHNCGVDDGLVWVSVAEAFSVCSDIGAASV
jgi:Calpain family cysteine protease/RTX calcium-binding nonapeptide repeat (4 copies)